MAGNVKVRAVIKFAFWIAVAVALVAVVARSYSSGQMASWFYYTSAIDGYAVNPLTFMDATPESPAVLRVGSFDRIDGMVAVPVNQGDRLPANATGVISKTILEEGKRAALVGNVVRVMKPWEIQQAKGFKYKDTFRHKGVRTYPWSAVWNVVMTLSIGLSLGFMAEGFTDLLGIKLEKIRHFEGH